MPSRQRVNSKRAPRCLVIAGPNGSGKTTFAQEFLPEYARVVHFVNADLIASGLSPFQPGIAAIRAGRLMLSEIDRLAAAGTDFALESTLSGLSLGARLRRWRESGYRIELIYLTLSSAEIALRRIALRVQQGGHDIPTEDVLRRFERSWTNFQQVYKPLADSWMVYDNSGDRPHLIDEGP